MILLGADFVPSESNRELFEAGDTLKLFGSELKDLLATADFRIFNLETPLCDTIKPIRKNGANFVAPTACVKGYCSIHTDLLALANNHILDQDIQGLESTLNCLKENHIDTVGAGKNLYEAAEPYLFSCFEKSIGVYACAEHEFSIAGTDSPGANPFDPLETPDRISELKKNCDYVIVLYHGGKEHYRYPSPALQKTCRKLIDKGADLVVCQHSHCIGCEEHYGCGTIVYGQGNFLFDNSKREEWQTSLLIGIDDNLKISYYPLIKSGAGVRIAPQEKADEIMRNFNERSSQIMTEGFVEKQYLELAKKSLDTYLVQINGKHSVVFRILNKLSGYRFLRFITGRYGNQECITLQNFIECEAHRELLDCGLRSRSADEQGDSTFR